MRWPAGGQAERERDSFERERRVKPNAKRLGWFALIRLVVYRILIFRLEKEMEIVVRRITGI